jgi:hypothetical protein
MCHPESAAATLQIVRSLFNGNHAIRRGEKKYKLRDGSTLVARLTVWAVRDDNNEPVCMSGLLEPLQYIERDVLIAASTTVPPASLAAAAC